jgi:hypothetical protein
VLPGDDPNTHTNCPGIDAAALDPGEKFNPYTSTSSPRVALVVDGVTTAVSPISRACVYALAPGIAHASKAIVHAATRAKIPIGRRRRRVSAHIIARFEPAAQRL